MDENIKTDRHSRDAFRERLNMQSKKKQDAVQRILEVCTELHLTWHDLDSAVDSIKREAYISVGGETAPGQKCQEDQTCFQSAHADLSTEVYRHFGLDLPKMRIEGNEHDWGICRKEDAEKCTGNMAGFGMGQSQQIIIDYDKGYDWILVRRIEKDTGQ